MKNYYLTLLFIISSTLGFAQCGQLYDGFESGSYSPLWTNNGAGVFTVDNTNPGVGNYSLLSTTGTSHLLGLSSSFTTITPNEVTWYIYPTSTGAESYFVAGDATMTANDCIVFCYWQGSTSSIRFFNTAGFNIPASLNQWYEISIKDIDWVNRNFDIYVNGVLQTTDFAFRSTTINTMSQVHLYHLGTTTASRWDHILFDGTPLNIDMVGTDISCHGGTDGAINLTVGNATPPLAYTWNNGSMIEDPSGLTAGTYYVDVVDGNGCTGTDTLTLSEPTQLTISGTAVSPTTCGGTDGSVTITVSGGVGGNVYNWSNGDTLQDIAGVGEGSYIVTVMDSNSCSVSDTFNLIDPIPTSASISWLSDTTCSYYGVQNLVGGSPAGGTWSGTGVNGNSFDPISAGLGTHTLAYVYTDVANCTDSVTAIFVVDECLALIENFKESVSIYPNPTSGEVIISYSGITTELNLEMSDVSGKLVLTQVISGNTQQLDVSSLKPGVYYLKISSGFASMVEQLIIH